MSWLVDLFSLAAIGAGVLFFVAGTAGLLRFPDPLSRLHALATADKLGLGLVVIGLMPRAQNVLEAVKLLLIWLFALLASAVVGQLLAARIRTQREAE
jgi:multicomponent Na+:H+ antiporter subunit G